MNHLALLVIVGLAVVGLQPAEAEAFPTGIGEHSQQLSQPPERLARSAAPNFRRELNGTAFFVDGVGHMLTARHAVEECARVVVVKEGRSVAARVVALSPRADLALIKVPTTLGLAAVFPRTSAPAVSELMFAASYDSLPKMVAGGGTLANAAVANRRSADGRTLELESNAGFGTSGAPVLNSRGLVEGIVSRRRMINRVEAVGTAEAKAFLASQSVRPAEDDRPQIAGGGSRAHRAASISARVTCLQN